MDFTSPPEVIEAIRRRVDHGVFGYAVPQASLVETLQGYLQDRIGVTTPEEQIVHLGGLVPALSLAARAFGKPGDALLTCTPSYPPFLGIHHDGDLELLATDHVLFDGRWTFDWEALEETVTPATKLFILSNPQNPMARAFTKEEIVRLATFCERHDLILVSDEIHCDLILDESKTPHFSALNLPDDLRKRTITLLAPSKTYNIAGLGYAFAVIPDDSIRRRFTAARGHTLPEINCIAYEAAEAAYRHGESWRQDLLSYLRINRDLITSTLSEKLPTVKVPEIEATYLAWIDGTSLEDQTPIQSLEEAGLFLSDGAYFGHGRCFRLNFGTQTARLQSALETIVSTFS
jgi:cystathionine beta-lyase